MNKCFTMIAFLFSGFDSLDSKKQGATIKIRNSAIKSIILATFIKRTGRNMVYFHCATITLNDVPAMFLVMSFTFPDRISLRPLNVCLCPTNGRVAW